jgi:membrane protease YdiL (CAAX protease family)
VALFWKVTGKIALAVAALFVFAMMVSIPLLVIGGMMASKELGKDFDPLALASYMESKPLLNTLSYVLSSGAAIGAALLLYKAFERDKSWPLGWAERHWLRHFMIGLLLGILLMSTGVFTVWALGGIQVVGAAFTPEIAYAIGFDLILFVTVGFSEEIFSRGYVYGLVKRHYRIPAAVVVSSVIFALLHSMNAAVFTNVFPMLNLFLAGVLLALLREASGGLWMPIGVHITWNFFQGNIFGMAVSGMKMESILQLEIVNAFIAGGGFGLEGSFVNTLVSVIACTVLVVILLKRRAQAKASLEV